MIGPASQLGCMSCTLLITVLEPHGLNSSGDGSLHLFYEGEGTLQLRFTSGDHGTPEVHLELYREEGKQRRNHHVLLIADFSGHAVSMASYKFDSHREVPRES